MAKRNKGFTLIELLVVVAVVGILAALVIPNAMLSIQKAKQKQTMKEIISIATATASYATDAGAAPDPGNQAGPLADGSNFVKALSPTYIKLCPIKDNWGNPFRVYTGSAVAGVYGIPAAGIGDDDFLIVSLGSDKQDGGTVTFTYQQSNMAAGLYSITSIEDFKNDLINLDGSWLHAPRIMISGSGT
jgi:type II secretion system protein G